MGKNVLENLYYGNIQPYAKQIVKNSKYDTAIALVFENEQKLGKLLDEENFALLEQMAHAQGDINEILSREHFIEGFTLAMQIAFAALSDEKSTELRDIAEKLATEQ